mmetsp:Transcript_5867/g.7259  ORF Transcript_5867/g.7259 Transcript_5867/m.7259 type:complete len:142 (-) Transcript_5867:7-432(-)
MANSEELKTGFPDINELSELKGPLNVTNNFEYSPLYVRKSSSKDGVNIYYYYNESKSQWFWTVYDPRSIEFENLNVNDSYKWISVKTNKIYKLGKYYKIKAGKINSDIIKYLYNNVPIPDCVQANNTYKNAIKMDNYGGIN